MEKESKLTNVICSVQLKTGDTSQSDLPLNLPEINRNISFICNVIDIDYLHSPKK